MSDREQTTPGRSPTSGEMQIDQNSKTPLRNLVGLRLGEMLPGSEGLRRGAIRPMPNETTDLPSSHHDKRECVQRARRMKCPGIGRNADWPKSLLFYFDRVPTDEQMRFLHEVVQRACACMPEGL